MSGIFGIMRRDGVSVEPSVPETMRRFMANWGPDGANECLAGSVALGQMRFFSTDEARYERMPVIRDDGTVFTASGRVDNREELIADCRLQIAAHEISQISDGEIILHAYLKWGEDSPKRIYGDWSFAAWHPKERRLFLARDHYGNTALYYCATPDVFAFASSYKALLALNLAPIEMDELYLAQVLISWHAYQGERTVYSQIKRLPPAHSLTVTPDRVNTNRYWTMEDTPELLLPNRADYVDAFRDVFNKAVQCRIRSTSNIGVSLSGGLDSGAVAATAARFLRGKGKHLQAFTSVPLFDTSKYEGERFGDESSFARATAQYAGNIKWLPVTAPSKSPIQAIRKMLSLRNEPGHAAGNLFWIHAIYETAVAHGCRVLLTGAKGNGGISWEGSIFSQSLATQLRTLGWKQWLKETAKQYAPPGLLNAYRKTRQTKDKRWKRTAIHPDFANRLNLFDLWLVSSEQLTPRNPHELRYQLLRPGRAIAGSNAAELGADYGLDVWDPTADVRVLAFTHSVPDHIFIDPKSGMDRMLIRDAMKGHLPDEVRLNRKSGTQAADLIPRLRACAGEVEEALSELENGPAFAYVDVPYLREVWGMVQTQDTREALIKACTVLTRGIRAGLFVNGFGKW